MCSGEEEQRVQQECNKSLYTDAIFARWRSPSREKDVEWRRADNQHIFGLWHMRERRESEQDIRLFHVDVILPLTATFINNGW